MVWNAAYLAGLWRRGAWRLGLLEWNQPMFHGKPQRRGHHVPDFVTGFMAELGRIEPRQVRLNVES